MESTIYALLNCNKKASIAAYKILCKLKGLTCKIQTPVEKKSIFGYDDVVDYDEFVTKKKQLLVFGLFKEAGMGGYEEFDTFIDDVYVLTTWMERLPIQTLVEVSFCGKKMSFKVDDHRNAFPTTCQQLFIKNILRPAT